MRLCIMCLTGAEKGGNMDKAVPIAALSALAVIVICGVVGGLAIVYHNTPLMVVCGSTVVAAVLSGLGITIVAIARDE